MGSESLIKYPNDFVIGVDLAELRDDGTEGHQERILDHPTVKREGASPQVVYKSKLTVRAKGVSPTYLATIATPHYPEASSDPYDVPSSLNRIGTLRIKFTVFQQPKYHRSIEMRILSPSCTRDICFELVPTVQATPGIWIRPLPTMTKL